jgi:hypothetical protein
VQLPPPTQAAPDCLEQLFVPEGLDQQVRCAGAQGTDGRIDIGIFGSQYDLGAFTPIAQHLQPFEDATAGLAQGNHEQIKVAAL